MTISDQMQRTVQKFIKKNEVGDARLYGTTTGVVMEIGENENQGKVRVEIPTREKPNNSYWVDVTHFMAGDKWGSYFMPELEEKVKLVFDDGNINNPTIIGSIYAEKSTIPGKFASKDNYLKGFKSKGGFEFILDDTPDEQSLKLTTPNKSKVFIKDGDKTITFSDENGSNLIKFNAEKGTLEVKSDKKTTVQVQDVQLVLNGESGQVTVKCDKIKLEAQQSFTLKTQNMKVNCDNLSIKANGSIRSQSKGLDIGANLVNIKN
ncbi:MAG: hypothetical protein IJC97_02585 [Oscillospiraceae bacterium]|nr:hypothetical protein [Oscillospiraceae bacterium]